MTTHGVRRGTYATTSTHIADARRFAPDNGINSLNGNALLIFIVKRSPDKQQEVLNVAFKGDYWRPTCARSGIKLA